MNAALWIYAGVMTACALVLLTCAWADLRDERSDEQYRIDAESARIEALKEHDRFRVSRSPYDWNCGPDFVDPMELLGLRRDPEDLA